MYINGSYSTPTDGDGAGIPGGWTLINSSYNNNIATDSNPTNRNLPPYVKLHFIKFTA